MIRSSGLSPRFSAGEEPGYEANSSAVHKSLCVFVFHLQVTNISLPDNVSFPDNMRLPTHFLVDLQTSVGENATIFSPMYQPENLNTTMNITVSWTLDDSVDICNLHLTVTVSAVNNAGSTIPSNPLEISVAGKIV